MLLATICFTILGAVVKTIEHLPTHQIVFFRASISLLICLPLLKIYKVPLYSERWSLILTRALFGTAGLFLFFYTIQNMPLASAMTLNYMIPIFTILFAGFITKEKSSAGIYLSFIGAFLGVALIQGFDPRISLPHTAIALAGTACAAMAHNLVRSLRRTEPALRIVFYFPLVTTLIMTPWVILDWTPPSPRDWFFLILTGVLTLIAQLWLTKAYFLERASRISNFIFVGAILSLFLGYVFFDEKIPMLSIIGMLVILVSIGVGQSLAREISEKQIKESKA